MTKEQINFSVKDTKVKTKEKYRKGNLVKMKIEIELSKEDAEAWKNYLIVSKPELMLERDFIKLVFFKGLETINKYYSDAWEQYKKENPDVLTEIPTSGF